MNTAHFAISNSGDLIPLGYGPDTAEVGNALADLAESIALSKGTPLNITSPVLNVSDLYRLKAAIVEALDNLDNEALLTEVVEEA